MFELEGMTEQEAKTALAKAAAKLPIKTRFIARAEVLN
jgi:ribosomal protein L16/L10AE